VVVPIYDENPTRRPPYVTWALIAVNIVVFLLSPIARVLPFKEATTADLCAQQAYILKWGAVPVELAHNDQLAATYGPAAPAVPGRPPSCLQVAPDYHKLAWLSSITSIFIHAGWLHLIGNMLYLWVFGNNVEDRLGRIRYLIFYLLIGVVATYGFALTRPNSAEALVGASGAIAAVLGAYLILFPRARVLGLVSFLFFLPLRLPAWIVLGLWFALQAVYARGAGLTGGGEVAYLVHVLGFAMGVAYIAARGQKLRPPPRPPPPLLARG
jgi:membrane associated rhomboid family serine protease